MTDDELGGEANHRQDQDDDEKEVDRGGHVCGSGKDTRHNKEKCRLDEEAGRDVAEGREEKELFY